MPYYAAENILGHLQNMIRNSFEGSKGCLGRFWTDVGVLAM